MKKFFAILFVLLFSFSCAFADVEIDFSNHTEDELITALYELRREMWRRGLTFDQTLLKGTYTVGDDIPPGVYVVYPFFKDHINSYFYVNDSAVGIQKQSIVELYEGDELRITLTPLIFWTYYHAYIEDPPRMTIKNQTTNTSLAFDPADYTEYSYRTILRHSDDYRGKKISIKGEIIQVVDGPTGYYNLRVATSEYSEDVYLIFVTPDNAPDYKLLDGDIVTIYGSYEGEYTYTSTSDHEITVPSLFMDYIILHE